MGYRLGNGIGLYFPVFQAVRGKIGIWNVQWLWFLVAVAACVFRAVLLLIPGIVLSHFGLVGAGDMKLMAVFAVWLGLKKRERSLLQDFF